MNIHAYKYLALVLLLVASNVFAQKTATVFFIPFERETYIPVTKQTVECASMEKWMIYKESTI